MKAKERSIARTREERQRDVDEIVTSFYDAYWRMKKRIREL